MHKAKVAMGLLIAIAADEGMAQVYRCENNGKKVYTDKQCSNAETVEILTIVPHSAAQAAKRLENIEKRKVEEGAQEIRQNRYHPDESERESQRLRTDVENNT